MNRNDRDCLANQPSSRMFIALKAAARSSGGSIGRHLTARNLFCQFRVIAIEAAHDAGDGVGHSGVGITNSIIILCVLVGTPQICLAR